MYVYLCKLIPIITKVVNSIPAFIDRGVLDTTIYIIKFVRGVSSNTLVSSTNKTDSHDLTEILLIVALITRIIITLLVLNLSVPITAILTVGLVLKYSLYISIISSSVLMGNFKAKQSVRTSAKILNHSLYDNLCIHLQRY